MASNNNPPPSDSPPSSLKGGEYPPYGIITDDNHGSYVIIATWILACASVLFVIVRVVLRTWTTRKFGLDNGLIMAALCCAIAQSITASEAVKYGLGKQSSTLDKKHIRSYHSTIFAADLLSIFVFVFSKLSLIHLISQITPSKRAGVAFSHFIVFTILWGLSYIFSLSFQCGVQLPTRASDSHCVNERGLVFAHGIINIFTDSLIAVIPVFIVWKVQIQRRQRILVMGLFWSRLCVCVTAAVRLSTIGPYLSGNDPTWNYLIPTLWNQISIHLSIITACVPSIKPFFDSLQSSLIDSGIPRNYISNNVLEMSPWRSSNKSSNKSSRMLHTPLRGMGLSTTTRNEIEGGVIGDQASAKGLVDSVIHQQRDVDIVIAQASAASSGSRIFDGSYR